MRSPGPFHGPTVHAGFDGTLTLEMINLGNAGITLYAGKAIAQLILETVLGAPVGESEPISRSNNASRKIPEVNSL